MEGESANETGVGILYRQQQNLKNLHFLVNCMSYCWTHGERGGYTEYITALTDRRSNPDRRQVCFSSPKYSERFQNLNGLLFIGHRSPFPGVKRPER